MKSRGIQGLLVAIVPLCVLWPARAIKPPLSAVTEWTSLSAATTGRAALASGDLESATGILAQHVYVAYPAAGLEPVGMSFQRDFSGDSPVGTQLLFKASGKPAVAADNAGSVFIVAEATDGLLYWTVSYNSGQSWAAWQAIWYCAQPAMAFWSGQLHLLCIRSGYIDYWTAAFGSWTYRQTMVDWYGTPYFTELGLIAKPAALGMHARTSYAELHVSRIASAGSTWPQPFFTGNYSPAQAALALHGKRYHLAFRDYNYLIRYRQSLVDSGQSLQALWSDSTIGSVGTGSDQFQSYPQLTAFRNVLTLSGVRQGSGALSFWYRDTTTNSANATWYSIPSWSGEGCALEPPAVVLADRTNLQGGAFSTLYDYQEVYAVKRASDNTLSYANYFRKLSLRLSAYTPVSQAPPKFIFSNAEWNGDTSYPNCTNCWLKSCSIPFEGTRRCLVNSDCPTGYACTATGISRLCRKACAITAQCGAFSSCSYWRDGVSCGNTNLPDYESPILNTFGLALMSVKRETLDQWKKKYSDRQIVVKATCKENRADGDEIQLHGNQLPAVALHEWGHVWASEAPYSSPAIEGPADYAVAGGDRPFYTGTGGATAPCTPTCNDFGCAGCIMPLVCGSNVQCQAKACLSSAECRAPDQCGGYGCNNGRAYGFMNEHASKCPFNGACEALSENMELSRFAGQHARGVVIYDLALTGVSEFTRTRGCDQHRYTRNSFFGGAIFDSSSIANDFGGYIGEEDGFPSESQVFAECP